VPIASGSPSIPPAETLIHDALIITVDPEDRILDPGDLLVEDGRIAYVGPARRRPSPGSIRARDRRAVARRHTGLVNAHTYTYATLLQGHLRS
jgi:5-methylthioadenosine/S-adenosylhomocysteine deaminase